MKVFINPGHSPFGNPDTGAINIEAVLRECERASAIERAATRYLAAAGCETRLLQSDNLIGEGEGPCVVDAANDWGADLFVAIHCNAAGKTARGAGQLCYGADSAAGRLARCIQGRVTARSRRSMRRFRTGASRSGRILRSCGRRRCRPC